MEYPILVTRLSAEQSLRIVCNDCEHYWDADNPEDYIEQVDATFQCWNCRSLDVGPMYEQGQSCLNCGKMGHWADVLKGCCSRPCVLQHEWALELERRRSANDGSPSMNASKAARSLSVMPLPSDYAEYCVAEHEWVTAADGTVACAVCPAERSSRG